MNRKLIFKLLLISLLATYPGILKAQDSVYVRPQKLAVYPGGYEVFLQYLGNNIRYRDIEIEPDQRKVAVSFIVEADGTISNVHTGRGGNDSLRKEAIRVMLASPKWEPAYNDGKPVRSAMTLGIAFGKGYLHESYSDELYNYVDIRPKFHGGDIAFDKFIADNLQYPKADREKKISGIVTVSFVVEKDGSLTDIKATDGPTEAMKAEAVRVMKLSPKWFPGVWEYNKYVRTITIAEVPFTL